MFFKLLVLLVPVSLYAGNIPFSIYHTNDLHSHFDGVKYSSEGAEGYVKKGGFDRLATAIEEFREDKKSHGEIVIGVDAGDFFAGTVFSAIAPSNLKSFPEYEFLSRNHFDVVTLGNHEFDAGNVGLEKMFAKAASYANGSAVVATNLYLKNSTSPLAKYVGQNSLIKSYVIKDFKSDKGNLRVAFLGVLGPDACLVSKATRGDIGYIGFKDDKSKSDIKGLAQFLNPLIKDLREKNQVQVIVISMHGGGEEVNNVAKSLKGVDVIIAGHTHEVQFSVTNGTIISQTGSYGENLGLLEMQYDSDTKKVSLLDPDKKPFKQIDEKTVASPKWMEQIGEWRAEAAKIMGQTRDLEETVFTLKRDYIRRAEVHNELGNFVTDILLKEINNHGAEADFYFTSLSLIRGSLYKGVPYNRADIFEMLSIGFDEKLDPGVKTITFYLTAKEVKALVNFMELYSHISKNFTPAFSSNLEFDLAKYGVPFVNRIKNLKLNGKKLGDFPEDQLIKVATNQYVMGNLGTIATATHGLVKIDPKDSAGNSTRNYPTYSKEYQLFIEHFTAR